jgi:hypothetical protein
MDLPAMQKRDEPLPRSEWSMIVRVIARFAGPADKGVGDTLEKAFAMMGADVVKDALKRAGIDCGCSGRKAWFNARYPYG